MKIRTIKLREAHNCSGSSGNGEPTFCSILWDQQGKHIVTASSSDPNICIHDPLFPSVSPKLLRNHREGVTALTITPNSSCLASGSIDHSVKLFKFPGGEFETNITRFTLPIRTLAFNKSGTMLAAAGDDDGIKLINTVDGSIARVLKGHKGSITGIAYDPKSEYLASVDSIGTVIHWELQSGTVIQTLKGIAPDTASESSIVNTLSWSPDGDLLAVPGLKNEVVMYDRDTLEKLFSLKGDHVKPICFLCWSPNGKYMATSGLDRQVLIWDVDKKQDIDRQKFNDRISSMAWKPCGNALALIDVTGKYGIWEPAVPSSMKSPTEDIPAVKTNGLLFFDEEEEGGLNASENLSDAGEDSSGESELYSRKRLREKTAFDDSLEDDVDKELDLGQKLNQPKKACRSMKDTISHRKDDFKSSMISTLSKMQEAFQPGATPSQSGRRRFLCYNMFGFVTSMEHDGSSHIEVEYLDTGSGPRVPAMADHFGFTMAALSEDGHVLANPCKGGNNMSTLMFRPFGSWASFSEWSMRLEDEEVKAVALGTNWLAAATSLNLLRIFSLSGLQRHIISLDGPIVTLVGFKEELAVVTHASPSLPSNEQMLELRVLNICSMTERLKGRLPLTPGSCLTWFGFSEEGQLSSFDSKGFLRVFTHQYGGSWIPLFSASKSKKPGENYWVVGLNESTLFCVICKSPDSFPQVTPKPIHTLLDLSFPLVASDLGAENLENEFMQCNLRLHEIQRRIDENENAGLDTTALNDEAFKIETTLDRCILKLIELCCKGDKIDRATELVKLLTLEKKVRAAIVLATRLNKQYFAERFSSILEERLMNYENERTTFPCKLEGNAIKAVPASTMLMNKAEESCKENDPKFITPPPSKQKAKVEQQIKDRQVKIEQSQGSISGKKMELKSLVKASNALETTNLVEGTPISSNHPSNPFAKKSHTPESISLLDTLKKMRKPDDIKK